jgi:hypothetical protein
MNEAVELIRELVRERFYGAISIKFEAGRITIIKKEQTIKPSTSPEQPGKRNNENQCK